MKATAMLAAMLVLTCLAAPIVASPATQPASQPDGMAVQATVVDVRGSVDARPATVGGQFKPVAKGDLLAADTLISTGPKSQVVLSFGDNSVVVLEQFSIMTIDKVYTTRVGKPTVVTRLNLVNGSVRAGVERGRTDSDFQVKTPVATLSVRGTRPIRLSFNAGNGHLWFALGREGLIRGTLAGGGRSQDIRPGEGTNQSLTLPVLMAIFDKHVQLGDPWGETMREFLVEVGNPNSLGNFGGGNPQTLGQQIRAGIGGSEPIVPRDDEFFPDDDDDSTSVTARRKVKSPR